MDVIVKITVPQSIYRFYSQASRYVANYTAEEIMADALSAYAGLLSRDIAKAREQEQSTLEISESR